MIRISLANSRHLYFVETETGDLLIEANNRDHAARIARCAGFTVRSVNMEG